MKRGAARPRPRGEASRPLCRRVCPVAESGGTERSGRGSSSGPPAWEAAPEQEPVPVPERPGAGTVPAGSGRGGAGGFGALSIPGKCWGNPGSSGDPRATGLRGTVGKRGRSPPRPAWRGAGSAVWGRAEPSWGRVISLFLSTSAGPSPPRRGSPWVTPPSRGHPPALPGPAWRCRRAARTPGAGQRPPRGSLFTNRYHGPREQEIASVPGR